jgi:hypothetical protein
MCSGESAPHPPTAGSSLAAGTVQIALLDVNGAAQQSISATAACAWPGAGRSAPLQIRAVLHSAVLQRRLRPALLALVLGAAGCSTSRPILADDLGPDARRGADGSRTADQRGAEGSGPSLCTSDSDCRSPGYNRCSPSGRCVVCLSDADCVVSDYPFCTADGNCGSCRTDADCRTGPPPWASPPAAPFCGATGYCVACTLDAHCQAPTPVCKVGACVDCRVDGDCASSAGGALCRSGACGCEADAHCASAALGSSCDTKWHRCGCAQGGHCTVSVYGPVCYTSGLGPGVCSCASSTQCKAPNTTCRPLHASTAMTPYVCAPPCTTDCGCGSTIDCAIERFKSVCDVTLASCVECLTSADCTSSSLGKVCGAHLAGTCSCSTDADCSANLNGKVCDAYLKTCSCATAGDCLAPRSCTGINPRDRFGLTSICE